jgi:hypothetical protein
VSVRPFVRITTNIGGDLRRSLLARAVNAGETWGEFVAAVERLGVRPDDLVTSIEFGVAHGGSRCIVRQFGDDGIEIVEVV